MKEDRRKYNGGNKTAGRKPKALEELAIERIHRALKSIYSQDEDEEAVHEFLVAYGKTKDGMKFYAEHLLGKPKETVDQKFSFERDSVSISFSKKT